MKKPLHEFVREYIQEKIHNGDYAIGEMIPPERKLSEELGVSRHTVRKAIQYLVDNEFVYRVQGYGTFVHSRNGRNKGDSNKVGVVLANCFQELESKILAGIEEVLSTAGYNMSMADSRNDVRKEAQLIDRLLSEGVSGLIVMPADDEKGSSVIAGLKSAGFPVVLVDRKFEDFHVDCVVSDNISGSYSAALHLLQLGHRNIGFVRDRFGETSSIKERICGFERALDHYGVPYRPELVLEYDLNLDRDAKNEIFYNFVQQHNITAICAVHDSLAIDIVKMCRARNINIPNDLSLVGFDNIESAKHLEVPLTTVAQFPMMIGSESARLLLRKLQESQNPSRGHVIHQLTSVALNYTNLVN